jgi:heme-degrading monooxygenase HmoA
MFARVTAIEGSPKRIDESIRLFKETVVPGASKIKGFKGSYFLVDRKSGKQMGVALWETEDDLNASAVAANRLRAPFVQTPTQPAKVEIYEVAVSI